MDLVDPRDYPHVRFSLAGLSARGVDGPVRLTLADVDALPGISECIETFINILPDEVEPQLILIGASICVCLLPISPGKEGVARAAQVGGQVVELLEDAADKLRENSQLIAPLPYGAVVPDKSIQTVLKAFAVANEASPLQVAYIPTDGTERGLPVLDTAELPAISKRMADTLRVNAKVVGLIRGESEIGNELIVEGGTHVRLPTRPPWAWNDVHLILESPHWLIGMLVRVANSNRWTLDSDAKVTTQLEMNLDE